MFTNLRDRLNAESKSIFFNIYQEVDIFKIQDRDLYYLITLHKFSFHIYIAVLLNSKTCFLP